MKTAYPSTRNPVTITLYANIPFDNTYKHHTIISRLFKYNNGDIYFGTSSQIACERFINRVDTSGQYVYPRWTMTDTYNFNYTNGLVGSVVLELTAEQTNANFMKVVCGNDIYYYFITGITQVNLDTYSLALELDVLMTYQDEFLTGMQDVPVFTIRKHSHRFHISYSRAVPYCADLKTGEDIFANVKPSIVSKINKLSFPNTQVKNMVDAGVVWLYVCVDPFNLNLSDFGNYFEEGEGLYTFREKTLPLTMLAMPLGVNYLTYKKTNGNYFQQFTHKDMMIALQQLIGTGAVHGAKISPYPPFVLSSNDTNITYATDTRALVISSDNIIENALIPSAEFYAYKMTIGENIVTYFKFPEGASLSAGIGSMLQHGFVIFNQQDTTIYPYTTLKISDLEIYYNGIPSIDTNRIDDPKLFFSPFRKWSINAQYSSGGVEIYPEIYMSEYYNAYNDDILGIDTTTSAYIGDNNFYTKIRPILDKVTFDNYKYEKIGLSTAVNYVIPCGTDALDVFNATQSQSFYTSKVASGITSGISIAGGIGSSILGGVALASGWGAPMGAGLIAGGIGMIASGGAGLANTIKSTNAKIEDLKNTPDSINISGSNYITDTSITEDTYGLPYIVCYDVTDITKQQANDFFYNYGYQVARECYFNTQLYYQTNVNKKVDNNLFGRTIFNYIQIQEDITNKINAEIPHIVKQKISSIFNNGITIWNFFGLQGLWSLLPRPTENTKPEKWFMKNELDNTEYTL